MPWLSGRPDAGSSVFGSQANLVLILLTHLRDERLSQLCQPRDRTQNLWHGSARRQPLSHQAFHACHPNLKERNKRDIAHCSPFFILKYFAFCVEQRCM